jgi:hypothetical protein
VLAAAAKRRSGFSEELRRCPKLSPGVLDIYVRGWVACFHAVAGKHVLAEACLRPGGEGMAPTIHLLRTILPPGFEQHVHLAGVFDSARSGSGRR